MNVTGCVYNPMHAHVYAVQWNFKSSKIWEEFGETQRSCKGKGMSRNEVHTELMDENLKKMAKN